MARKNFKPIRVSNRILGALEAFRKVESERSYKEIPMNSFCEAVLWDFATGKLSRRGEVEVSVGKDLDLHVADAGPAQEYPSKHQESQSQKRGKRVVRP